MFKVGDKVRTKYSCSGNKAGECYEIGMNSDGGLTLILENINGINKFGCTCQENWELVEPANNLQNIKIMTLKEKFSQLFVSEPHKTFIQVGILDNVKNLTTEGQQVFMSWLLEKFGDEFKKEVADKLLEKE